MDESEEVTRDYSPRVSVQLSPKEAELVRSFVGTNRLAEGVRLCLDFTLALRDLAALRAKYDADPDDRKAKRRAYIGQEYALKARAADAFMATLPEDAREGIAAFGAEVGPEATPDDFEIALAWAMVRLGGDEDE